VAHGGGAMHRGASVISHIYYGFDLRNLFLRLDPSQSLQDDKAGELSFFVNFLAPKGLDAEIRVLPRERRTTAHLFQGENSERKEIAAINSVAANEIIELAIPFELLGVKPNDEIHCFITVERKGSEIEKWPYRGFIQVKVPTEDFEAMMWQV